MLYLHLPASRHLRLRSQGAATERATNRTQPLVTEQHGQFLGCKAQSNLNCMPRFNSGYLESQLGHLGHATPSRLALHCPEADLPTLSGDASPASGGTFSLQRADPTSKLRAPDINTVQAVSDGCTLACLLSGYTPGN